MDEFLARIGGGNWPDMGTSEAEVICAVGRQLAYRLDKLIDLIERGEEREALIAPISGPGAAHTPIGRLVELQRLELANFPKDHRTVSVGTTRVALASNPYSYTIPILVTNLDNAQFLYYGSGPVNATNNSPMIDPEESMKLYLNPEQDLYVVVAGPGNVTVAVSNLALPVV